MHPRPARLGWRLLARVVDTVAFGWLVSLVIVEVQARLVHGDVFGNQPHDVRLSSPSTIVSVLILGAVYEAIPTAAFGATLGKLVLGLRVRRIDLADAPPGVLRGVARWLLLSLGPLLAIPLLFGEHRRGLHDLICGTFVVQIGAS